MAGIKESYIYRMEGAWSMGSKEPRVRNQLSLSWLIEGA